MKEVALHGNIPTVVLPVVLHGVRRASVGSAMDNGR